MSETETRFCTCITITSAQYAPSVFDGLLEALLENAKGDLRDQVHRAFDSSVVRSVGGPGDSGDVRRTSTPGREGGVKRAFFYERITEPSEPRWGKLPMRIRWVFASSMNGGPVARCRCFWHCVIRGYRCEICQDCGRPVSWALDSWWGAPDDLWLRINGQQGGTLCPRCFHDRCDEAGVPIHWKAVEGV